MSLKLVSNFGQFPKYDGYPMESSDGNFSNKLSRESIAWIPIKKYLVGCKLIICKLGIQCSIVLNAYSSN